jgi:DNA (cytosine-5)-methyltransferase 1
VIQQSPVANVIATDYQGRDQSHLKCTRHILDQNFVWILMFDIAQRMNDGPRFIDLFAGAGGLSEGFVRAGFRPIAHVESDAGAAFTLRTREAFHILKGRGELSVYADYLTGKISRDRLYAFAFASKKSCVINATIGRVELPGIFSRIDAQMEGKKPDLIVGGPPCQAYSVLGRAVSEQNMIGDKRNYLFLYYAEFLKRYRPKYFVFENVVGLLSAREENGIRYLDMMTSLFNKIGYIVEWQVISTDEIGVPQKRKRIIIIGRKGRKSDFFPELQKCTADFLVRDAIGDLPALKAGKGTPLTTKLVLPPSRWLQNSGLLADSRTTTWHVARPHNPRDLKIFSKVVKKWDDGQERLSYNDLPDALKTHKNRNSFLDRFKVVASDLRASHTIVAHIAKDGNYYIHPDKTQNRSLTPREAARLQTFPDDFHFESLSGRPSRTSAFKQIGNAVPIMLAEKIAEKLLENWS